MPDAAPAEFSLRTRLGFALIVVCVCLLMAEGGLRIVRQLRDQQRITLRDPVLHHIWAPSRTTLDDNGRTTPYELSINRQSWVETYDVEPQKPEGVFRIFFLGDSNTQGLVPPAQKMVEIVERELNDRFKGKLEFEAINTGTSSYSFILYDLLIRTRLLEYDPDLVIFNIDMTDVTNDYVYRQFAVTNEEGEILAVPYDMEGHKFKYVMLPEGAARVSRRTGLYQSFIHHTALGYFIDKAVTTIVWRRFLAPDLELDRSANWLELDWTAEIQDNVRFSMQVLRNSIDRLRSRGIRVMVNGVPHHPQFAGRWSARPHGHLQRVVEEAGVPFLNTYEALKPQIQGSAQREYYWGKDATHFNAKGNRLWAEAQLAFLLEEDHALLPFERLR